MNERPRDRDFEDFLAGRSDLTEMYRRLGDVEPSPDVDARILAEARRAAAPRRRPWWRGAPAFATVAVLAVGLSVMVLREPTRHEMEMAPAMGVGKPAETTGQAPATSDSANRALPSAAPPPSAPVATPTAKRERAMPASDMALEGPARPDSENAKAPVAEGDVAEARLRTGRARDEAGLSRFSGPSGQVSPETTSQRQDATSPAELREDSDQAVGPPPPAEEWLRRIETLLDEGSTADAREELLQFRNSYPDYELPSNLMALLPAEQRSP